jgi:hypothetical protein
VCGNRILLNCWTLTPQVQPSEPQEQAPGKTHPAGVRSPKPEPCFEVTTKEEFLTLPAGDCDVLRGLNHVLIHPICFFSSEGPRSSRALHLAWAIISNLLDQKKGGNPNDAGILAAAAREMTTAAPLLAFLLWASTKGLLSHVPLLDPPGVSHVNLRCKQIRAKIRETTLIPPAPKMSPRPAGKTPPTGVMNLDMANLAMVAQSLTIMAMTTSETNRVRERAEDKKGKSFISNFGPRTSRRNVTCHLTMCTDVFHGSFDMGLLALFGINHCHGWPVDGCFEPSQAFIECRSA